MQPATTDQEPYGQQYNIFDEVKPLPVYYSMNAIYIFSVLGSVIFGTILFAINCNEKEDKKGFWQVIVFGFAFFILQIIILDSTPRGGSSGSIIFGIGAGLIIKSFFWPKYIGNDTEYIKRSVIFPAIICAILYVFTFGFVFWAISYH